MSRRKRQSNAGRNKQSQSETAETAGHPAPPPNPQRPNRCWLAPAVLLECGWLAFLVFLALRG